MPYEIFAGSEFGEVGDDVQLGFMKINVGEDR